MAQQQPTADGSPAQSADPNQYHLHGGGLSVSYYPTGSGPLVEGKGPQRTLFYQDAQLSLRFDGDEIRLVPVNDLGILVSVTLVKSAHRLTTFSLLLPVVVLFHPTKDEGIPPITSVHVETVGILVGQEATYTVTSLSGIAQLPIQPELARDRLRHGPTRDRHHLRSRSWHTPYTRLWSAQRPDARPRRSRTAGVPTQRYSQGHCARRQSCSHA